MLTRSRKNAKKAKRRRKRRHTTRRLNTAGGYRARTCSETSMLRRTKIVATLGPATDGRKALDGLIQAGVDVVRINFSHGEPGEHRRRVEAVRNRARAHGRQVGVLADLQGPKIRIDRFKDGKVNLIEGDRFTLDANWPANEGNRERVGIGFSIIDSI